MFQRLLDFIFSRGLGTDELVRRLDFSVGKISNVNLEYREFSISKRSGKPRLIAAPNSDLKKLQRRILRRILAGLKVHPQATGFQPGISFVDNARCHQSQAIVVRFDIVDFFPSITQPQIQNYFRRIGWNRKAARLLTELTTHRGVLPQGAPTSPRLSNLVNYRLDARLSALAAKFRGVYTRYADDITMSFSDQDCNIRKLASHSMRIIREHGYQPHLGRKFTVQRKHKRQMVTGLVVNDRANLPREKRRWLRAVEHRMKNYSSGGAIESSPTLNKEQLRGWQSLRDMVARESNSKRL